MNNRILIAGRDKKVLNLLHKAFKQVLLDSNLVADIESLIELVKKKEYDLILMESELAGDFSIISKIRQHSLNIPIVVLGEQGSYDKAVHGFDMGIDDYICLPVNTMYLVSKIKASLRFVDHIKQENTKVMRKGPFTYNSTSLKLFKGKNEIELSTKESAIIKMLMENEGQVFSKEMIYGNVWSEGHVDDNTVMVYINRIRQKIEDDPATPKHLLTIRGKGYEFRSK